MLDLIASLRESDVAILEVIATVWKVDTTSLNQTETVKSIHAQMTERTHAERVWETLDDGQRGALQTLIGADGKMALTMFSRLYGDIRKLGKGAIQREQPHKNPQSIAEGLFYRGLLYEGYEQAPAGARPVVYVPIDLMGVLPSERTAYDDLEEMPAPDTTDSSVLFDDDAPTINALDPDVLDNILQADTSLVDDLTTMLAYLRINTATLERHNEVLALTTADETALSAHLLDALPQRLAFMLELAISADLVDVSEGKAHTRRSEVRRWLEASRSKQLKILADAWHTSTLYRELWHVPGLHPEAGGWRYDPVVARAALLGFMRGYVPKQDWWSMDEFILTVKESEPDFQRPGGDYDSWYIRNEGGDYLNGFESWDAVDGALLEFYLMGPLHWLGMVDLAEDAARLNAYGRAFVAQEPLPDPRAEPDPIIVQADGTVLASRRVTSVDRFQLARFTTWDKPATRDGAPYHYRLTAQGVKQADAQGINTGHIASFLGRFVDGNLPQAVAHLLDTWQSGASGSATIETLLVLRTTSQQALDQIVNEPALRRYTGARLGPMAVIVRASQWEALRDALGEQGVDVEIITA